MTLCALPKKRQMPRKTPEPEPYDHLAGKTQVWFTPNCLDAMCQAVSLAVPMQNLYLQQSCFENRRFGEILGRAGVNVRAIFDRRCLGPRSLIPELVSAGVECLVDYSEHVVSRNALVVEPHAVYTGSFTLAADADDLADDLVRIPGADVVKLYLENWRLHASHSRHVNGTR